MWAWRRRRAIAAVDRNTLWVARHAEEPGYQAALHHPFWAYIEPTGRPAPDDGLWSWSVVDLANSHLVIAAGIADGRGAAELAVASWAFAHPRRGPDR